MVGGIRAECQRAGNPDCKLAVSLDLQSGSFWHPVEMSPFLRQGICQVIAETVVRCEELTIG